MTSSVLLVSDQRAGRLPSCCALSGVATDHATRITAVVWDHPRWILGIPGVIATWRLRGPSRTFPAAVPIHPDVWRCWRSRSAVAGAAITFGLVGVVWAAVVTDAGLAVLGALVAVVAAAYRTRAAHNFWITCQLDPGRQTIVVTPTHATFDADARRLFERSLNS